MRLHDVEKNMGWPFYAAVQNTIYPKIGGRSIWLCAQHSDDWGPGASAPSASTVLDIHCIEQFNTKILQSQWTELRFTNRNGHKPKWPQTGTATNRNSHGLWPFRSVAVSVCGHFGSLPFRFVAVSVCGLSGVWPFRFVAVSVLAVSVCGRFDQKPFTQYVWSLRNFFNVYVKQSGTCLLRGRNSATFVHLRKG